MWARLGTVWEELRTGLWFVPGGMTIAAALLALALVELDRRVLAAGEAPGFYFAFGGGVQGARGVLTTIAGSLMTVTATVFSVTIVALQLASSQYTPRVLRNFTRDRSNQVVLGVFIGTFTYALLVLRTVRSAADEAQTFVPTIAITAAIGLALVAVGFLIFFIHHVAQSIRVAEIVDRAARDTIGLVERLFPTPVGEVAGDEDVAEPPRPTGASGEVAADGAGYLQAVDGDTLFSIADEGRLVVRMEARIGEFVLPGATLATVWPASSADQQVVVGVRRAFVTGPERTLQHDVELGIRQIADIAVRALSPAVNDPTTATNCVDRLAEILVVLGNREAPDRRRTGRNGRVCFVARETTFERAADLSFDQIRHYGAGDPVFVAHLLATLGRLAVLVPPDRRPVLVQQREAVVRGAREKTTEPKDLARIERAAGAGDERRDGRASRPRT